MNLEKYIPELEYNIRNFKLNHYPYSHCETNNFLPKELFDNAIKYFPEDEIFIPLTTADSVDVEGIKDHPYNNRGCLNIYDDEYLNYIKGEKHTFWKNFRTIFASNEIVGAFLSSNPHYLRQRYPNGLTGLRFGSKLQIIYDHKNYELGPHTDHPGKVFTMLIYLSDAPNIDGNIMGTSVYIPKDKTFKCEIGKHYYNKYFNKVYTAKFEKNNIFAFYRTNDSFHGVEKIKTEKFERKLLQYSIWQANDKAA